MLDSVLYTKYPVVKIEKMEIELRQFRCGLWRVACLTSMRSP